MAVNDTHLKKLVTPEPTTLKYGLSRENFPCLSLSLSGVRLYPCRGTLPGEGGGCIPAHLHTQDFYLEIRTEILKAQYSEITKNYHPKIGIPKDTDAYCRVPKHTNAYLWILRVTNASPWIPNACNIIPS